MTTPRKVTLINGDGIGPEVMDATRKVLEAAKCPLEYEYHDAGAEVANKFGTNLPLETVESALARPRPTSACASSSTSTPRCGR